MSNLLGGVFANLGKMLSIETFFRIVKLPSAILLIVVNLIPLAGIAFLKWNPFDILVLYWLENIVIGIYNFFRIIFAQGPGPSPYVKGVYNGLLNIFFAFFFLLHYGGFVFGHGFFLSFTGVFEKTSFAINNDYMGMVAFFIALMISHGFSYVCNYIGKREFMTTRSQRQMLSPYKRIFVMQITIIFGFGFSLFLPSFIMVIFVIIKTFFDLGAHLRVHVISIPEGVNNTESADIRESMNFLPNSVVSSGVEQERK